LGWLVQTRFTEGWIDLVECMIAGTALQSLPLAVQDLFSNVNPKSKVDVQRFKNRIKVDGNQLKLLFKGGTMNIHELVTSLNLFLLLTSCHNFLLLISFWIWGEAALSSVPINTTINSWKESYSIP
jgi:hypothetical protein